MPEHDLFRIFITRLNRLNVPYMITGSVAGIMYGEPRLTHDIDLVIELQSADVDNFCNAFPPDEFYCPPPEIIRVEIARAQRGHFNLLHHETGFKADIYAFGREDLHRWALQNRTKILVDGEPFWLAPAEYVIVRKLEYYREGGSDKHLRDIAAIVSVSSDQIDHSGLEEKIKTRMLTAEWQLAKNF